MTESDGVGKAALTRKRSNAMSQSSRHTTISSDRFSGNVCNESKTNSTSVRLIFFANTIEYLNFTKEGYKRRLQKKVFLTMRIN